MPGKSSRPHATRRRRRKGSGRRISANKQKEIDEKRQSDVALNSTAKKKIDQEMTAQAPASFDDTSNLRKEYIGTQQYKRYDATLSGLQQMYAGADQGSGPGDIALIYGFIKTLDAQSAVREGETALAQDVSDLKAQAEGWLQKMQGLPAAGGAPEFHGT